MHPVSKAWGTTTMLQIQVLDNHPIRPATMLRLVLLVNNVGVTSALPSNEGILIVHRGGQVNVKMVN